MGAAREDHEQTVGGADHPDALALLEAGVHADRVVRGQADTELRARLEDGARKEEAQEHQQIRRQEPARQQADQASARLDANLLIGLLRPDARFNSVD